MKMTPIEEIDETLWDRIYSVNVKGIFNGEFRFKSCREKYPELYEGLGSLLVQEELNVVMITELIEAQKFVEDNAAERDDLRRRLGNISNISTYDDVTNFPPDTCSMR